MQLVLRFDRVHGGGKGLRCVPEGAREPWGAPTLNQVYADAKGKTGWIPSGLAPKARELGRPPARAGRRPVRVGRLRARRPDALGLQPPARLHRDRQRLQHPRRLSGEGAQASGSSGLNPSRHQRVHEVLGGLPRVSLEDWEGACRTTCSSTPARRLLAPPRPALLRRREDQTRARLPARVGRTAAAPHSPAGRAAGDPQFAPPEEGLSVKPGPSPPRPRPHWLPNRHGRRSSGLEKPETRALGRERRREARPAPKNPQGRVEEMEKLQGPTPPRQSGKLHFNLNEHLFAPARGRRAARPESTKTLLRRMGAKTR